MDNETCDGCIGFSGGVCLGDSRVMLPHDKACDNFIPSLECRQVRALELIAETLYNQPFLTRVVE